MKKKTKKKKTSFKNEINKSTENWISALLEGV